MKREQRPDEQEEPDDVVAYQQNFIKGRPYTYCILGDKNDLDLNYLRSLGKIKFLSQEEIFGY